MCVYFLSLVSLSNKEREEREIENIYIYIYGDKKHKERKRKSTFGMRLAKCLKSRLTEKKKEEKTDKKRDKENLVFFFLSFLQSFDLYFMFVTVLVQKAMFVSLPLCV